MILACPIPIEFFIKEKSSLQKKRHRMRFLRDSRGANYLTNFIVLVPAVQVQDV